MYQLLSAGLPDPGGPHGRRYRGPPDREAVALIERVPGEPAVFPFPQFLGCLEVCLTDPRSDVAMTVHTLLRPTAGGTTERVDPVECLESQAGRRPRSLEPTEPGRYIQVDGLDRTQLVHLGAEVVHVGRGLTANLHLDESSVSRRHAIIIPRPSGTRILDDRSSFGTFVNGRRVEQADLHDGDVIVLGRVMLRYLEV